MKRRKTRGKDIINNKEDLVMRTAINLFKKKGYSNATMRQIAKACHMSAANLYNYVTSKKDILDKISADARQAAKKFKNDIKLSPENGIEDKFRSAIHDFFLLCDADADRIVIAIRDHPSFNQGIQFGNFATRSFISDFESLIKTGIDEGIFHAKDPKFIAVMIVFAGYDWATRRVILKGLYDLQAYTERQIEMILNHILSKEVIK